MEDFWQAQNRKRYLFNDIYDIDSTILRFSNWFEIEHELNLTRSYSFTTPAGDGSYEQEIISEEEYINNKEDSNYLCYTDYQDLSDRADYNSICKEFETLINDTFIHEEQNTFLRFVQKSVDQARTDGQAKSLLKSILQTLKTYSKKKATFLPEETLNRLQEIIVEAYSSNYLETLKILVRRYKDIYEEITKQFKEDKLEINQHEQPKQEKKHLHTQIFQANAYQVWQYMYEHFGVKESSRTDFKFMFDAMQYYGLIHTTVSQVAMLDWVNNTYHISIEKITPKKGFKQDTRRMNVFREAKELYKDENK
jgi:hypothetical protein